MGSGCDSIIEYRVPGDADWHALAERRSKQDREEEEFEMKEFGAAMGVRPVYIPRGWDLYCMLDVFGEGFEYGEEKSPKPPFRRRGPPVDMSKELDQYLNEWADGDARDRMGCLSLDELEQVSKTWDEYLVANGDDPTGADVTLRGRLAAARACAEEHKDQVRMIYWFSS
jgi:hypothetical protein